MSAPVHPCAPPTAVGRFADWLLGVDLPELPEDRRREVVAFVERRVAVLPSFTRFGVRVIAASVDAIARAVGIDRIGRLVLRLPLPLVSEYPRLVRSLGYAFIWETWPSTAVDGAAA
ncbi:MAG: hypothetical protein ACE37B_01035 [Ilumatobacter sp.]|jgi:hypothetical protein|uniref:hypothetical protein n=1 Tax=Ilumatobacter sp. TaxID=1967498 RepID=UPI00391CB8A5